MMGFWRFVVSYLTGSRLKAWGVNLWNALRWVWKALWYPAALPVVVVLALAGFAIKSGLAYDHLVREAVTYQDSIVRAQDNELWRLRADTLHANYEIRILYAKLDKREKEEVIYFEHLHVADDSTLQTELDRVYSRYVQSAAGSRPGIAGQPAPLQPGAATPEKFNLVSGWGATSLAKPVSGR